MDVITTIYEESEDFSTDEVVSQLLDFDFTIDYNNKQFSITVTVCKTEKVGTGISISKIIPKGRGTTLTEAYQNMIKNKDELERLNRGT